MLSGGVNANNGKGLLISANPFEPFKRKVTRIIGKSDKKSENQLLDILQYKRDGLSHIGYPSLWKRYVKLERTLFNKYFLNHCVVD